MLDVARVTTKGQITIPLEFRKILNVKEGDKVVFWVSNGVVCLGNSNKLVFEEFARGMAGEAEKAGLNSEEDVTKLVNEIREEMWERDYADNV
ncbi:MAG: AbrB/MazE/SpoVT family DNA-binding domain-containing protein [Clostridium sp.]|jgi:AbrB family looped-hinge helix DNA binding protein|nr:AbrB/MazE/SpoVT family DNA-binding domain-containing protein [Clostridium sp.]